MLLPLIIGFLCLLIGSAVGYMFRHMRSLNAASDAEQKAKELLSKTQEEAEKIKKTAKKEADSIEQKAKEDIQKKEEKIQKREDLLVQKLDEIDKKREELESIRESFRKKEEKIKEEENSVQKRIESIAGFSSEQAKDMVIDQVKQDYSKDLEVRIKKLEETTKDSYDQKAKEILGTVIHRLGNHVPVDVLSTTITIPSEDIKGKIIGKEGRNIKAFEQASGVELILDETPNTIIISCFDPVRRHIARVALENLIVDGRIQPARIEEELKKAEEEINSVIKQKGEEATYEAGVFNLDPRIISILGRLNFRTSYGQNVLRHSVEVAHIAGMLAYELGADVAVAKAGALLHDIGKAVDHEVKGSHVEIGMRILEKFGVSKTVIDAMKSHHEDYPYESIESKIVQVADAISASRPGARSDSVEQYIKRLEDLEAIAKKEAGVEKAYALAAGREIRVFVSPQKVSDLEARTLARSIATQIESELKYPGEIKVYVIRETRVIEFAR